MKTTLTLFTICILTWIACQTGTENNPANTAAVDSLLIDSIATEELEEVAAGSYFIKRYDGMMDGKLPISMVLINWGDGFLSGRYWYKGKNKAIDISGEMSDSLGYRLVETVDFKETGAFEGVLTDPAHLTGTWSNPKRTKQLNFDLREVAVADSIGWTGHWHMNEVWDGGLLLIGNVTPDAFDFALSIIRSSHIGTIEGQANLNGNQAAFTMQDFEDEPCKLTFEKKGDKIEVRQVSTNFACGFGARANADGIYEKKNLLKKAKLSFGPASDAVFPNQALHDAFKAMVGEEAYSVFAFNMQLTEKSRNEAPEKIKATVVKGFIGGLIGSNEAIIMYDDLGKMWAATIDLDKTNNESLVRYFTNDPLYSGRLPITIEEWREGFKSYRVVFQKQPL